MQFTDIHEYVNMFNFLTNSLKQTKGNRFHAIMEYFLKDDHTAKAMHLDLNFVNILEFVISDHRTQ